MGEEDGEEEDEYDEEKEEAAVLAEVQSESAQISVNVLRYTVTVSPVLGIPQSCIPHTHIIYI